MAKTAAHLVDHVLPEGMGFRQWVLKLPGTYRVAYDTELAGAILRAFVGTQSGWYMNCAVEAGIESPEWAR